MDLPSTLSLIGPALGGAGLAVALLGAVQWPRHNPLVAAAPGTESEAEPPAADSLPSADHTRLLAAVEGLSQALLVFGPDGRVAMANGRALAEIGQRDSAGATGRSLDELRAAMPNDTQASAILDRLDALGAGAQPASELLECGDGRALALAVWPLDTGGWVATLDDVTERRAAELRADRLSQHDGLTGLLSGRCFEESLATMLGLAALSGRGVAMLHLGLDHFQPVNDMLGRAAGDTVLRIAAGRIAACVASRDIVSRVGGDEFVVALELAGDIPAAAASAAERLIECLSGAYPLPQGATRLGVSVGIALWSAGGPDAATLMRQASLASLRAKAEGRGRSRFFEAALEEAAQHRRLLEDDLRRGLAEREFELFYQPIIGIASGRVRGLEALIRWRHPTRGMVSPAEFIPLAEECGLIVQLGERSLRMACQQAAEWPAPLRIAVNLSPVQFREPWLVDAVRDALAQSGLSPHRLELEITEGVLLQHSDATRATLEELRNLGVRIVLDDFGTGHSSLSYLRQFPFDKVKIDKAFVQEIVERPDDAAIVRAITRLCLQLGLTTTAEGVETSAQLLLLGAERCTEAQGYLFSRPVPASEVPAVLERLGLEGSSSPKAELGFQPARMSPDEAARIAALDSYELLDTAAEQVFDDLAQLAARVTDAPIALVSLVDRERQWFKARVGLDAQETPRDVAFCAHAILRPDQPMVVRDATSDPRFVGNPLVLNEPGIRFYAGVPVVNPEGHALGTLCVLDRVPRELTPDALQTLQVLARSVAVTLELRRVSRSLHRLALTDTLTGLPNRVAFLDAVTRAVAQHRRNGQLFSLLYLDCDNFKAVNDTLGHAQGDVVLRQVAATLAACIREEDLPARLGGDEFAALLVGGDGAETALTAERVRSAIEQTMRAQGHAVTVSVGGACFTQVPESAADALAAADRLLYTAKRGGRNRVLALDEALPPPRAVA